jgi:hypothetical protein
VDSPTVLELSAEKVHWGPKALLVEKVHWGPMESELSAQKVH